MIILPRPTWPALSRIAPRGFFSSCKGNGVGMEGDFSLASQGGMGMNLDFLDLTRLTLPRPTLIRVKL